MVDPSSVSVVIPAYNEAQRLPATLAAWARYLEAQPYLAEIVVVGQTVVRPSRR